MKYKILSIILVSIWMFFACVSTDKQVLWVSGFRTEADGGAGRISTLYIQSDENSEPLEWVYWYAPIDGFVFEEGILKKIEVQKNILENIPADGSSIEYRMMSEIERMDDPRMALEGAWILSRLNDKPLNRMISLPDLEIRLNQMQFSGNGGCNNYTGRFTQLGLNSLKIGTISQTQKQCLSKNVEAPYLELLSSVSTYRVEDDHLDFYNDEGESLLSYIRKIQP